MRRKDVLRRAGAAVLAAAVLLAGGGCAVRAQTAFVVDGAVTTISQVTTMMNGCTAALNVSSAEISAAGLVDDMIRAGVAGRVAAANNIVYSDEELRQPIENGTLGSLAQAMLGDPFCTQLVLGLTLETLAVQQLGNTAYITAAGLVAVTVNPRFGTWNPAELSVDGTGSLSQKDG